MNPENGTGPVVVGIGGGSASGKTTITADLRATMEAAGRTVAVLACDSYMTRDIERGPSFVSGTTGERMFDCNRPDSVDWAVVERDLRSAVQGPEAPEVLLVEGMMVLYIDRIRRHLDLRLFVELDADERALRRMLRDMQRPRGITDPALIAAYYRESARIGHDLYVEPSRVHADLILRGDASTDRLRPLLTSVLDRLLAQRQAGDPVVPA